MLRGALMKDPQAVRGDVGFRWRGADVSRLENLSDIVFAFALSLIVASGSVPRSFDELIGLWRDMIAFAFALFILLHIWREHYLYFRRFGLSDQRTIVLNGALLFMVLAFAYPLKFVFVMLVQSLDGPDGAEIASMVTVEQIPYVIAIYAGAYAVVQGLFCLMYWNAWSWRDALGLDAHERGVTLYQIASGGLMVGLLVAVALLTLALPGRFSAMSVLVLLLAFPVMAVARRRFLRPEPKEKTLADGPGADEAP